MVTVEPCSTHGCQGMSIDGLDGRCNSCLTPNEYIVTGTIFRVETIKAFSEEEAEEEFIDQYGQDVPFDEIEVDEQ